MVSTTDSEPLASELGISSALAAAAERLHGPRARQVLLEGLAAPLRPYEGLAPGSAHGDEVFEDPFVRCLLEAARQQVAHLLAQQGQDRCLIAVRSYGRAGPTRLQSFLRSLFESKRAKAYEESFRKGKVTWEELKKMSAMKPAAFRGALKSAGVRMTMKTVKLLAKKLAEPLPIKQKKALGLKNLTLRALEEALGPEAYRRCLIFVAHADPAWAEGHYAKALQGTPWAERLVLGVRGADLQVRFMEEACPKGTHLVVADDNIEQLIVEVPTQELIEQQKGAGINEYYMRSLTLGPWPESMAGTGLVAKEESQVMRYLRAVGPKKLDKGRLEEVIKKEALTVDKLRSWGRAEAVRVLGQMGFRHSAFKALRALREEALPPARRLVEVGKGQEQGQVELLELIRRAGEEMENQKVHLWGVNPSRNHYYLHSFGENVRKRAVKKGVLEDFSTRLGLVYGAFFGLRVLHDPRRYTRQGQVKDDVERSLRYWHLDGKILRFMRYGADKRRFKPGQFSSTKGGISTSGAAAHNLEAAEALRALLADFGAYARAPRPGEPASCGLIFKRKASEL